MSYYRWSSFMTPALLSPEIAAGMINSTTQSTSNHSVINTKGKLSIVEVAACERDKSYAIWNDKAIEMTHDLQAVSICPSDMNGVPCEHDKARGYTKIRLYKIKPDRICKQVEEKKQLCAHAHGHQTARQRAFDEYWVQLREARYRGSKGAVAYKKTW